MNLLARRLHGTAAPAAIIAAAHREPRHIALPFVEAGPHRAFVGMIAGPAATWVRAREAVRERRWRRLARAAGAAWRRTWGRGIAVGHAAGLRLRYQALFVAPADGRLSVAAVDARDWRQVMELGWSWVSGDWLAARAVDNVTADRFALAERRPVAALFDGEPVTLPGDAIIGAGITRPAFLATLAG
jgi:diacylglycerol kinase family enzyme